MTDDIPDHPAIRALHGVMCPMCGAGGKQPGRALCDTCCAAIGPANRAALCCSADAYPAALERVLRTMRVGAKFVE